MENQNMDKSLKKKARIAGLIYLAMAIFSAFGVLYVPSKIIVDGDAAKTAENIMASEGLFRMGIASNLIGQVIFIFLVMQMYSLFKAVNKQCARIMVGLVVAAVPIMFMLVMNQIGALVALDGADYLKAFSEEQTHTIALILLNLYSYGIYVVGIFWGLWLLPFGYLAYKSGFIPRVLGILLIVSGVSYLVDSFTFILAPGYHETVSNIISAPTALGEFAIILWLLIMGVKRKKTAS